MEYLYSILDKILYVILLMATGILAKRAGWLSDKGEEDLSVMMVDFIWPCMIFSSIVTSLTRDDIVTNISLPILAAFLHLFGFAVGLLVCRLAGYQGERKSIFLFHASMNNFLVMALPFAEYFFPERGVALLAVANLGSIVLLWTLGVSLVAGRMGWRTMARNVFLSPGLIATGSAILCVMTGINRYLPTLVTDVMTKAGEPTLFFGLMVAGTQIHKLGFKALRFDGWNILVGLTRNIVVPGIMLCLMLLLRGHVAAEGLVVLGLVSITPASINSVMLAIKYKSSPKLAAEGVIFTHLLAIFTMIGYVYLIEVLFMSPL